MTLGYWRQLLAFIVIILIAFLFDRTTFGKEQSSMNAIAVEEIYGADRNAQFTVRVASEYLAREPVIIRLAVHNRSRERLSLLALDLVSGVSPRLVATNGVNVRTTPKGRQRLPDLDKLRRDASRDPLSAARLFQALSGSQKDISVKPGESYEWTIQLDDLYDLSPGVYQFSARIPLTTVPQHGRSKGQTHWINVNNVPIRITEE